MSRRIIKLILLFVTVCSAILVIVLVPNVLTNSLLGNDSIPLGSVISWGGLIAYALLFYLLRSKTKSKLVKRILLFNVLLSLLWGVISALLCGKWAFLFQNSPILFKTWIAFILLILIAPVLVILPTYFHKRND